MSGTFPASPAPYSMTLHSLQPTRVSVSHNLKRQVRGGTVQQWAFDLEWEALTRAQLAPILAFALAQKGQYETFTFIPPVISTDQIGLPDIGVTRNSIGTYIGADRLMRTASYNVARHTHDPVTGAYVGLLIEPERTNIFLQSEQFNLVSTAYNLLITINSAADPSGSSAGDVIKETASGSVQVHYLRQNVTVTAGKYYTFSVYAKDNGGDQRWLGLHISRTGQDWVCGFDLRNGTATAPGGDATSGIMPAGNGFYRCWISRYFTETESIGAIVRLSKVPTGNDEYAGDGVANLKIWGAQFEDGAMTSYIPTVENAVQRKADEQITQSPQVNGATSSGNIVQTDGWPATMTVMKAGDFVKFASHNKVYSLAQDAVTNSAGQTALNIIPGLYGPVADDSVVTHTNVSFTVALAGDAREVGFSAPVIGRFACKLVEVL